MGDSLSHEFSLNPVDTGRRQPGTPNTLSPGDPNVSNASPGAPITRPSFLQAFLANLGPALAGGLAAQPGQPFGTGLSGALQGTQQAEQLRWQRQVQGSQLALQQAAAQRQQQLSQAQIAETQAQTSRLQQLTPLDVRQKQLETDLMQGQIQFFANPGNLQGAAAQSTQSLGPLSPAEQAQLGAATKDAQLKRSFDPINTAVQKIAQDRFQVEKADETSGFKDYLNNPALDKGVKKDRATFIAWKAKQNPMAVIAGNMLPAGPALDQQAQLYAQTHELPQGLARSPGTITAIINRAAQLNPEGNLAGNQATFKADQASLSSLQKNFDQVTAFENTAIKNLDQVVKAGAKIPDLGTRFGNIPVRSISSNMLGTPDMARFKAALLTAKNEAARVLTTANASGVLSDEARKEASDVLDGNLPYPAMLAAISQLKTDFANRHSSYQQAIGSIKSRMGGKPASGNRVIDLTQP